VIQLLKEFKDIFTWTYKDLKGIPPEITQHWIELDTSIPPVHQTRYRLNHNYLAKHDIDKLLVAGFVKLVEEVNWLSPIVVVPKKNMKLIICVDLKKLNVATNKYPCSLLFTNDVINIITKHEVYKILDGFSGSCQIIIITLVL